MGKKWEAAIGEISGTLEDGDTLLTQTKNDSQRKRIKRQEDEDEAEHKSRMARLGKETATSERAVEKTEETGTGFKVTGGLDMGHINYQELMQRQIADREVLRKEAAESAAHNQALSEDLRERLHAQEMLVMTEREKRNMFAAPFETVGMALAKGLMDSNGGVSADAGDQSQHKQKRSGKRLEVNQGESGVTNCPECGEPVAIAPTARSAVCSSCDAVFPIDRVPLKAEGGIHGA